MIRKLKNTIIYLFARAAVVFIGATPAFIISPMGRVLGSIARLIARRERLISEAQLREHMGASASRADVLSRGVFRQLGLSLVELCRILLRPKTMPRVVIPADSRKILDDALGCGKGVVYVTGHLGNWELMAIHLAKEGYPISAVARGSYDPRFTHFLDAARARFGILAIHRDTPGAAAKMLRALRSGRILGLLIDQDTSVPGAFTPFFGKPAHTPVGAAVLAARTGAPAVVGTIRRTTDGRHIIDISRIDLPPDFKEATTALTSELERRIRISPSQWVWFHRRWKTRPPGEVDHESRREKAA